MNTLSSLSATPLLFHPQQTEVTFELAGFRGRLLLRSLFGACRSPLVLELACAALRVPALRFLAERVFFGAVPLKIEGGDGSPCRAFAVEEGLLAGLATALR